MSRVTTYGSYNSALLNMLSAQSRSSEAHERFSTGKNATSLAGFGGESATVNALKSSFTKTKTYVETGSTVADRLSAQDLAMGQIADAATAARLAIANAIAAGRMDGLMTEMESLFQSASSALNSKHQGAYLFSGGVSDTSPSTVTSLADLDALVTVDGAFSNGVLRQASKLDDHIVMDTGFLADALGTELFQVFKDFKALDTATPLNGAIDGATDTALTALMARFEAASKNLINEQGRNGIYQKRVEDIVDSNAIKLDNLEMMLGDKTDADMARAVADMELAEIALQASAQVIAQLRKVSLLDYL